MQRASLLNYLSGLFCGLGGGQRDDDESRDNMIGSESGRETSSSDENLSVSKSANHSLIQGFGVVASTGDRVSNIGISGCGLVLGFGAKGIAAYHWPGMADSLTYHNAFAGYTSQVGALSKIEIYTSPAPDKKSEGLYATTAKAIAERYEVSTVHYFYGNNTEGDDLYIKLKSDGLEWAIPAVTKTFLLL